MQMHEPHRLNPGTVFLSDWPEVARITPKLGTVASTNWFPFQPLSTIFEGEVREFPALNSANVVEEETKHLCFQDVSKT